MLLLVKAACCLNRPRPKAADPIPHPSLYPLASGRRDFIYGKKAPPWDGRRGSYLGILQNRSGQSNYRRQISQGGVHMRKLVAGAKAASIMLSATAVASAETAI